MDTDIIAHSMELVAERVGDPAPLVFERLFRENPDIEALFVRDTAGLVRGEMLAVTLEALLDCAGGDAYAVSLVEIERVNHVGLGVEPEVFDTFFRVVMTVFREVLAEDWTPDMDAAWRRALARFPHALS
jgi:hemoglobin-like flavoprotein